MKKSIRVSGTVYLSSNRIIAVIDGEQVNFNYGQFDNCLNETES